MVDAKRQSAPIAQQEKQQVQHDPEADEKLQRVLANSHRLGGQELAGLNSHGRELLLKLCQSGEVQVFQQLGDPGGQRRYHLLNVGPKVELAAFDPLKNGRGLLYQRHTDERHGQNHHDHAQPQRAQGGQIFASGHTLQHFSVQGREEDSQHDSPENCAMELPEDGAKCDAHDGQQQQKCLVLKRVLSHLPVCIRAIQPRNVRHAT